MISPWPLLIPIKKRGRGRPRIEGAYACGHPRTPDNTVGHVQGRCRICKQAESARYRAANPDYFKRYRREHRQYFIDYLRAYRAMK